MVEYIPITTSNSVELADKFQKDLLLFEQSPLNITMSEYQIIDNQPPNVITMDASLYYRSWKLQILNKSTVKLSEPPISLTLQYGMDRGKLFLGLNKEITKIFNIPILLGITKEI